MVVMVLSQFCIFTVFRVISWTMPSAVPFGRVTQSPMRNMSFAESCTPDTNPKILSLNTNISTVLADHTMGVITHLLQNTDLSLKEIADITGFSTENSLSRFFSQHMKTPPNKFRINTKTISV